MSELFHIISDGSCDLPVELAKEKNITVVPFYVSFDDEHYLKENVDIGIREFYQQMVDRKGVYPKSSMPSTQDYVEAFQTWAEKGIPVICICYYQIQRFHAVSGKCQRNCAGEQWTGKDYGD